MPRPKIVMLPLDERPCNFDYPLMMPKSGCTLILPPADIMGKKKVAGDVTAIAEWVLENGKDAEAVILSLDTLVYGGILPSRLHHTDKEELLRRADLIKKLRDINPNMKLYVFGLIMRCPTYSSDDEEPDYYEKCGAEIHRYGKYTHLEKLGKLSEADAADFARVKEIVGKDELSDYLSRRETNLSVLMHTLKYAADGTVDYFIVPQDDAAVYGYTAMDQMVVREFLKANLLHKRTAMYPSADDTGMTLLARAVSEIFGVKPKIYVHYSSSKGGLTIPQVEDRILDETVKYHILSVGGVQVYSLPEADILLAVNVGSAMVNSNNPKVTLAYDIERNLAEFVNFIEYALECGKLVSLADVAWLNRGDRELTGLMNRENLLLKIHAYAGWNTSSNTIGTALCQVILYMIGKDGEGNIRFLLHRYYEDIGYMAYARKFVTDNYLPEMGLDFRHADGESGKVAELVKKCVCEYMCENYPSLASLVSDVSVRMPWKRMFEADIKLDVK